MVLKKNNVNISGCYMHSATKIESNAFKFHSECERHRTIGIPHLYVLNAKPTANERETGDYVMGEPENSRAFLYRTERVFGRN